MRNTDNAVVVDGTRKAFGSIVALAALANHQAKPYISTRATNASHTNEVPHTMYIQSENVILISTLLFSFWSSTTFSLFTFFQHSGCR